MNARAARVRLSVLAVVAAAVVVALTMAPLAVADKAGDVYKADIAKAKEKRAAALDRCKNKPTKAKRRACKQKASDAFAKAKQKAKTKRDKAREKAGDQGGGNQGGAPRSPAEERQEMIDCIRDGGRPSECRAEARKP
jgi:F0F1-type ATP synthase membrane subunit b/b'